MRRELIATIGAEERTITVEHSPEGVWRVSVDGDERGVDARKLRPGVWSLLIEGRSYLVDVSDTKRGTDVHLPAGSVRMDLEDARRKRLAKAVSGRAGGGAKGEEVCAPIAGKVVKLLVAVGDAVEAGQGVCVLEAMKMENEITAEVGGTVESIHVEPGVAVDTYDKLVVLSA